MANSVSHWARFITSYWYQSCSTCHFHAWSNCQTKEGDSVFWFGTHTYAVCVPYHLSRCCSLAQAVQVVSMLPLMKLTTSRPSSVRQLTHDNAGVIYRKMQLYLIMLQQNCTEIKRERWSEGYTLDGSDPYSDACCSVIISSTLRVLNCSALIHT